MSKPYNNSGFLNKAQGSNTSSSSQKSGNTYNLGGSGGGTLSALFSIGSRKKAYKRSIDLMNRQADKDKEFWDHQNRYNTPARQMQRLKEAGLNPALMYGQGTTGNANNMVQSKFQELTPYTSSQDLAASTASGVQMALAGAQKKLLKDQANLASVNAIKASADAGLSKMSTAFQEEKIAESKIEQENKIHQRMLLIQQEKTEVQKTLNAKAEAEIKRTDANYLKNRKTSTYELNLYRALKGLGYDTYQVLQMLAERLGVEYNRIKG